MVSGFTDDRQVRGGNRQFADNWELSAQRALTVMRALIDDGVPASAVFAAAFGPEQPVASTPTPPAGRRTGGWRWRRCRAGVDPLAPGVDLPARGVDPPAPSIDAAARPASGAQALADLAATVRAMAPAEALPELRALRRFRRQWAQLRAEQRLAGALAQVPAKAGPLHSTGLAVRAIALMRARSPGYLQHLVVHADALLWLEAATGDDALPLPSPMRGAAPRRPRPRTGR
jgi:hypothetical protein